MKTHHVQLYRYAGFLIAFLAFGFFGVSNVHAAAFSFETSTAVVHQGQEIDVNILLDPQGMTVNTIAATIQLPENLAYTDFDDSASVVSLWVDEPRLSGDKKSITFSGIIPGGFSGLIDPFAPTSRKPGNLIRLVFRGKTPGAGLSSMLNVQAYLNDGAGTQTPVVTGSLSLVVDGLLDWIPTEGLKDTTPPLPFTPIITRDVLLYNNKYVLIFNTKDKESGISHYEVKEGTGAWVTADSPYVLQDQTIAADILVKAVDRAGNERIEIVRAHLFHVDSTIVGAILSILALGFCIAIWVRRSHHLHDVS